jgi:nucleotide-binding universal stress UspA family protein
MIIAKQQNADMLLLHVYQAPVVIAPESYDLVKMELDQSKQDSERGLKALELRISHAGGVNFSSLSQEGAAAETILEIIKTKNVDLVIMGAKGSGLSAGIFGNTTTRVIERAICPVMAIPGGTRFDKPIRKITYATDYHRSDVNAIGQMADFAKPWSAQLNVLHISTDNISPAEEKKLMSDFMTTVLQKVNYKNFSFQLMHGDDAISQLEKYLDDNSTDILVMSTHHRGFFERIFRRSATKTIAIESPVPLIAFHHNQKTAVKVI